MQNLVSDLSDAVEGRIRYAFDLTRIAKEVLPKGRLRDFFLERELTCV